MLFRVFVNDVVTQFADEWRQLGRTSAVKFSGVQRNLVSPRKRSVTGHKIKRDSNMSFTLETVFIVEEIAIKILDQNDYTQKKKGK